MSISHVIERQSLVNTAIVVMMANMNRYLQESTAMSTTIDPREFRRSLAQFATGIVVVTTKDINGKTVGLTMNSFSSVSMDPPLVLFSIAKSSFNIMNFVQAKAYAINVLGSKQRNISDQFSRAGEDKWKDVKFFDGELGVPILDGVAAYFECTPFAQCDGGDHTIFVARVEKHKMAEEDVVPLLFYQGQYRQIGQPEEVMNA